MSRENILTHSEASRLFSYDPITGDLFWAIDVAKNVKKGTKIVNKHARDGYVLATVNGRQYQAHRVVWLLVQGSWPAVFIDHINGNRSDNRISNLREADRHTNAQNIHKPTAKNKSTGVLGVSKKARGRFVASIRVDDKSRHLGSFDTLAEAHTAYILAKRKYHPGCTT